VRAGDSGKIIICGVAATFLFVPPKALPDPPRIKEARLTQIVKEVQLLPAQQPARDATLNDQVAENTAVRTGVDSRSELTFEDLTITRLGANTIFSFNKAGRFVQLDSGSVLLRVPKDSGGAEIRTTAVTAAITGTTVIFETTRLGNSNLTVLEGSARFSLNKFPKKSVRVVGGKMVSVKAGALELPKPTDVDLEQLMKTHPLIVDFPPLPSEALITAEINKQHGITSAIPPPPPPPPPPPSPTAPPTQTATPKPTPGAVITTYTPRPIPTRTPRPKPTATPRPVGTIPPVATATPRQKPPPRPLPTVKPTPTPGKPQIPPGKKPPRKPTPTPTPTPVKIQ
jgi:FecR protein